MQAETKRRLNLGAGNRIMHPEFWVNHDRWAHRAEIDATHDLEELPWPWGTDAFDEVLAFDVLEHVYHPIRFIEELWRISAPGAAVSIHTCWAGPQSDARHAWRDPTHVRPWHELSFSYFDPINGGSWYENYGQFYSPARFEQVQVKPEPPDNILFKLKVLK